MLPKAKVGRILGGSASSTSWLQRKAGDQYTRMAHEEGMIARSAYKLRQILYENRDLRGSVIIDLGAAPGGWTRIVQKMFPKARIIAVDIKKMEYLPNTTQLVMDFTSEEAPAVLAQALAGRKVDLLLSDMAPPFSGQRNIDHLRLMDLAQHAMDFAIHALKRGGHFVIKVNRGGQEPIYKKKLEYYFQKVSFSKPDASYKDSSEVYLVAKGFLGIHGRDTPPEPIKPKQSIAKAMEMPFGELAANEIPKEDLENQTNHRSPTPHLFDNPDDKL